jgi:sensor histidine kinase regulating citrate/malate metabolism
MPQLRILCFPSLPRAAANPLHKYSRENVPPLIRISALKSETALVIKIEDNGLGIDLKRYGTKLFGLRNTFHNNKDSRGVGLFLTKAQVEAMQGSIYVDSEPNKGSTFSVELPKMIIV